MRKLLSVLLCTAAAFAETSGPVYTAEGIVSSATGLRSIGMGTLVTIYGTNLSFRTAVLGPEQVTTYLPVVLAGTQVFVNNVPAPLYYVSPTQINFYLSNSNLGPRITIRVMNESRPGPDVKVEMQTAAPGLFLASPRFAVGTRADGSVVTEDSPVKPGEVVVLYATGLGPTIPAYRDQEIPSRAAFLVRWPEFQVTLNGEQIAGDAVFYAGVTPGFAGLYQVNLRLPAELPDDPEVRIGFEGQMSPEGIKLPLRR